MKNAGCCLGLVLGLAITTDTAAREVICTATKEGHQITQKHNKRRSVLLPDSSEICKNGFSIIQTSTSNNHVILLTNPSEPGPNAWHTVYLLSFDQGTSEVLGEIPASAELVEGGTFVNKRQEGGSIFLEKYKINSTKIETSPVTMEMVIDGTVCLDDPSKVWTVETGEARSCIKKKPATFGRPVCLMHSNGKTSLSQPCGCKEITSRR